VNRRWIRRLARAAARRAAARRGAPEALQVLVTGERTGRAVRESNTTSPTDETVFCAANRCGEPLSLIDAAWQHTFVDDAHQPLPQPLTIYWQTRRWLEVHGYITTRVTVAAGATGRFCRLTKAGRELVKDAGIGSWGETP
jgi:hypothetical protein